MSSESTNKPTLKFCSCLNVRVTLTCPTTEPTEDPIHPSFQWCWLSTNQGLQSQFPSLTLNHYWDENWVALRCLNCSMDVYSFDTTDSFDSSESLRPILFNKNLKSELEAEALRASTSSFNSSDLGFYSPAFKIIISPSKKVSTLNPVASSTSFNLSDFLLQLDSIMDGYIKRQETAMQLRIEEFREEQQRLLDSSINAARLASSQLCQDAQLIQLPVSSALNPFGPTSPEPKSATIESPPHNFDGIPSGKETPQDSDEEDFSEEAQESPLKQASSASENMGYLSSSFNEDIFDLDEDFSHSSSSPGIQNSLPVSSRPDLEVDNAIIGSFAAQGRHFLNAAPKFIPKSSCLNPDQNQSDDSDSVQLENNVDLSDMIFSSSLPISIHPRHSNPKPSEPEVENSDTFEAPHELASRTYVNDKDQLFGGVPRSIMRRLGI